MARRGKDEDSEPEKKGRKRWLTAFPVRLILLFLLLVWLMYILADRFGIEGEGGWQGEIMGAFLFILGIIVAAGAMVGAVIIVRNISGGGKNAPKPWENAGLGDEDHEPGSPRERPDNNDHPE